MAYQTSCASYTSGRVGLSSATAVVADAAGREQTQHGSPLFPIACYAEDLSCFSVAWHWHEEFEFILAALGPIHVDVNKTRLTLQTGQGVFINSGALHAVEPAEGRALLHSGVFQPRLVGGMDTVFWQKLIRPLLQPGTPPFFCWTRPYHGSGRYCSACGRRGRAWRTSPLTTRTGCATTLPLPCGCSLPNASAAR